MESQVCRIARLVGIVIGLGALPGFLGCGGGGSSAGSAPPVAQTPSAAPITQSDIVLPSSVQVVTAK